VWVTAALAFAIFGRRLCPPAYPLRRERKTAKSFEPEKRISARFLKKLQNEAKDGFGLANTP
jgi:hypothetical protein